MAMVSPVPGTTADPVRRPLELLGVGPVVLVDTAGLDEKGELGAHRAESSWRELLGVDLVLLLFRHGEFGEVEQRVDEVCEKHGIAIVHVLTHCDLLSEDILNKHTNRSDAYADVLFSANDECAVQRLKEVISARLLPMLGREDNVLPDVVSVGDTVLLVAPIDKSAPVGRLILPQVQTLRSVLDLHASALVCQPDELPTALSRLRVAPRLVITDSQAFAYVAKQLPSSVPLTSFSIVMARKKGMFHRFVQGTRRLMSLNDADRVLILESCTHTVGCGDIGRELLPRAISSATGRKLRFDIVAGDSPLPSSASDYALAVQCGGCMASASQLRGRLLPLIEAGVPVSNYGMALAWCNGIFEQSISPFMNE